MATTGTAGAGPAAGDAPVAALRRIVGLPGVLAAAVVDVDSGLPLLVEASPECRLDLELVTAGQADLLRAALGVFRTLYRAGPPTRLVVSHGERLHHLVRSVADPFGDRLALAVLVCGRARALRRLVRHVGRLSDAALVPPPIPLRGPHAASPSQTPAPDAPAPVPAPAPGAPLPVLAPAPGPPAPAPPRPAAPVPAPTVAGPTPAPAGVPRHAGAPPPRAPGGPASKPAPEPVFPPAGFVPRPVVAVPPARSAVDWFDPAPQPAGEGPGGAGRPGGGL